MSQSYLIFSQGRRMEIQKASGEKMMAMYKDRQEFIAKAGARQKIISLVHRWERGDFTELIFQSADRPLVFEIVKSAYDRFITAAGGLVTNRDGKLLVIFRNGKWDLPKGKIEKDESSENGALREVVEETGLNRVKINKEFIRTYHTYLMGEKRVLKETVWYLMSSADNETNPQLNEGITSTEWISADRLQEISSNTHESILLLLKTFFTDNT